jgi:hypothetical protein
MIAKIDYDTAVSEAVLQITEFRGFTEPVIASIIRLDTETKDERLGMTNGLPPGSLLRIVGRRSAVWYNSTT